MSQLSVANICVELEDSVLEEFFSLERTTAPAEKMANGSAHFPYISESQREIAKYCRDKCLRQGVLSLLFLGRVKVGVNQSARLISRKLLHACTRLSRFLTPVCPNCFSVFPSVSLPVLSCSIFLGKSI